MGCILYFLLREQKLWRIYHYNFELEPIIYLKDILKTINLSFELNGDVMMMGEA